MPNPEWIDDYMNDHRRPGWTRPEDYQIRDPKPYQIPSPYLKGPDGWPLFDDDGQPIRDPNFKPPPGPQTLPWINPAAPRDYDDPFKPTPITQEDIERRRQEEKWREMRNRLQQANRKIPGGGRPGLHPNAAGAAGESLGQMFGGDVTPGPNENRRLGLSPAPGNQNWYETQAMDQGLLPAQSPDWMRPQMPPEAGVGEGHPGLNEQRRRGDKIDHEYELEDWGDFGGDVTPSPQPKPQPKQTREPQLDYEPPRDSEGRRQYNPPAIPLPRY